MGFFRRSSDSERKRNGQEALDKSLKDVESKLKIFGSSEAEKEHSPVNTKKGRIMKKTTRKVSAKQHQKSTKRSVHKKTARSSAEREKDLLKLALRDLDKELKTLRDSKNILTKDLGSFSRELGTTQSKEIELRNKISNLMKEETVLVKKRAETKDKITELNKKIEKVTTVERELKSV